MQDNISNSNRYDENLKYTSSQIKEEEESAGTILEQDISSHEYGYATDSENKQAEEILEFIAKSDPADRIVIPIAEFSENYLINLKVDFGVKVEKSRYSLKEKLDNVLKGALKEMKNTIEREYNMCKDAVEIKVQSHIYK